LVAVFIPSMESMKTAGEQFGLAITAAFSSIVAMMSVLYATILKLTESVLTGWLEIGKLTGVISEADAAALQGRIDRIGESAASMAGLAERSFAQTYTAVNQFTATLVGADNAIAAAATTNAALADAVEKSSAAYDASAAKIVALTAEIEQQRLAVDAAAEANRRGEVSNADYGAAVQKLWQLQAELKGEQQAAVVAQNALTAAQQAAAKVLGVSLIYATGL
jgi:flagellar capping protein FliD